MFVGKNDVGRLQLSSIDVDMSQVVDFNGRRLHVVAEVKSNLRQSLVFVEV